MTTTVDTPVQDLLDVFERQGITLSESNGNLRYQAPKGTMTSDLLDRLKYHKQDILKILRNRPSHTQEAAALPSLASDPANRHEPFPLTDVQHAYWIGRTQAFALGNVSSHNYFEIQSETIDPARFNRAWQQLVERHDMLRAVVRPDGEQEILKQVPDYEFQIRDLRHLEGEALTAELNAIRNQRSHQVLPADKWPLFDIGVTRITQTTHRFHLGFDFLVCDAASMMLMFKEWWQLYQSPNTPLPPIDISFRDYVLADEALKTSGALERAEAYWQERIPHLSPAPDLPLAKDPALATPSKFVRMAHILPKAEWAALKKNAAANGLTPTGALLAAFSLILGRWSKTPAFTLNLTLFNRLPFHGQVNHLVGDFTALSLLAVDTGGTPSFTQLGQKIQARLWQDLDHRHMGGVRVLRELNRNRDTPILMPVVFTSLLGVNNDGTADVETELMGQMVYNITQTPQVWLDHQVAERSGCLWFNWDVVEDLFPENLMQDMFDSYGRLLAALSRDAKAWAANGLPDHVMPGSPKVVAAAPQRSHNATLDELFLAQASARTQAPAIISQERTLTYKELDDLSAAVAGWLFRHGARPNALVAVIMEKGWEQVAAVLGILRAGAAYVPIDPQLPELRRKELLESSQTSLLLTQSKLAAQMNLDAGLPGLTTLNVDGIPPQPEILPAQLPSHAPDDLAYVIYTSGSTGTPKGVMISHASAVNTILDINEKFKITEKDRVLALSNLNFDLSVYDIFGILAAGGSLVMPAPDRNRDPSHWHTLINDHGVTLWDSVPALMQMLVSHGNGVGSMALKHVLLSGDWIPLDLPDRIRERFPNARTISLGGATEAAIWSIYYPITHVAPDWKSIPYGKALENQEFHVLNNWMEPCPNWVPGHLYIGGDGLALGYWQDEEKTSAAFITHPESGQRLYRTGDLGRMLPDGNIEFMGREDTQVKIRGHRIELGEIEAAVTSHPAIQDAVVVARNQAGKAHHLAAYLVPGPLASDLILNKFHAMEGPAAKRWDALVSAGLTAETQTGQTPEAHHTMTEFFKDLDTLYEQSIYHAFNRLDLFSLSSCNIPDPTYTVETVLEQTQIHPRYGKWVQRALEFLTQKGYLSAKNGKYTCLSPLPVPELLPLFEKIRHRSESVLGFSAEETDLLLNACANLSDILKQSIHSAEIYTADEMPDLYLKIFEPCHAIIREQVQKLVSRDSAPLNIMEVGAGLGTATRHVLPHLPAQRTRYIFTDISNYFLDRATQNFTDFPFVQFQLLDLDKPAQPQGVDLHSQDLIIAVSVLHDTLDIQNTLAHLKSLLAPGGILLMVEETFFHTAFDLTMGLQQGFDRFQDHGLRPIHPLLTPTQWQKALNDAGFENVKRFCRKNSVADALGFQVIAANGPACISQFDTDAVTGFLEERLPAYMIPQTFTLLDTLPLTPNGKIDRRALPKPDLPTMQPDFVPPETPTEKRLAQIWSEILHLKAVGAEDDFFKLGGDSLLAIKLFPKIQKAFDAQLPVQSLFEATTLRALAQIIDTSDTGTSWSPLVRLRDGDDLPPFFCVHASDGFIFNYKSLSDEIARRISGPCRPFYGLRARGTEEDGTPHTEIAPMATDYLAAIKKAQPHGPYHIGGWSMGGVVAWEMAQQLHRAGESVALLVLMDPPPPDEWQQARATMRQGLWGKMSVLIPDPDKALDFLGMSYRELLEEPVEEQMALFYDGARFSEQLPPEMSLDQFKKVISVVNANLEAMCNYRAESYPGESVVFLHPEEAPGERQNFWKAVTQKDFHCHQIPGDHWSMIMDPHHISVLAQRLSDQLEVKEANK